MNLRIEFPAISPAIEGGTIISWHKAPGDPVSYGDNLFDVTIDEVLRMRRRLGARLHGPREAKYRKLREISVCYRVSSMDVGSLAQISAPQGTSIRVGDVVGHITVLGEPGKSRDLPARVAANLLQAGAGK